MNRDDAVETPDAPDPELPMLTAVQAAHLRALAAPYAQGGHRFPLQNLAHTCRHAPLDRWPELVAAHFADLRQASRGGESAEELLRGTHARLLPIESFTQEIANSTRYARVVADGLVFAYALDGPTNVRILNDADVARAGLPRLGEAAYTNLMRIPVKHEEVSFKGRAVLHSVYGDSPFIASKALFLSELARQATGTPLPDAGALVVVPTRHLLAYHPIVDGSVSDALNDLAMYALGAHEDGPGSLSPRVYWWHQGGLTSLTVIDHETRTFSLSPPPELLARMKVLTKLDRAGRLASRAAAQAPDIAELTHSTAGAIVGLAQDRAQLPDAFAAALTLGHARCAVDPDAARAETWDCWATAVQLGSALFCGAQPQECRLGEDLAWQLPATLAEPPADARAWLDAFYVTVVCRQWGRVRRLCQVPLEALQRDESVDAYVLHWIDTLQTYFSERPMDDTVEKLIDAIKMSEPEASTEAPKDFVNLIDYQPIALFHRLITRNHDAFAETLAEALDHHETYWGDSAAPRSRVALGLLAMACLAYDYEFPFASKQPYLPRYLLNRERIETIPG
ncbi:immunity 49 family protein [Streptomyces lydicus]|uniref:immunity 49 family protein n=1 Tax=Streptomyces lydicus TaxID=47763 RepID=UPI0037B44CED